MIRRSESEETAPLSQGAASSSWVTPASAAAKSHRQLAATLNIAAGALYVIVAIGVFIFLALAGGMAISAGEPAGGSWLGFLGFALALFLVLLGLPSIVAGWALYVEKGWSKPFLLVLSALHLPNFPLGTALGVYTMWVLLSTEPTRETSAFGSSLG